MDKVYFVILLENKCQASNNLKRHGDSKIYKLQKKKNHLFCLDLANFEWPCLFIDATNDNRLVFMILTENGVSLGHEQQRFKKRPTLKNNAIKI